MYAIAHTTKMYRDMKRIEKRGKDLSMLTDVLNKLSTGNPLPAKYRDHALKNNRKGYRECHIDQDWLLIYRIYKDELILLATETGTHSDLYG